mmetsp:Transcript_32113/g.92301  ORF Transcript_32113/g.92301 Transcript_32113/m.92301 type:complete len:215 (+) Transcript_32113:962-1606(+)
MIAQDEAPVCPASAQTRRRGRRLPGRRETLSGARSPQQPSLSLIEYASGPLLVQTVVCLLSAPVPQVVSGWYPQEKAARALDVFFAPEAEAQALPWHCSVLHQKQLQKDQVALPQPGSAHGRKLWLHATVLVLGGPPAAAPGAPPRAPPPPRGGRGRAGAGGWRSPGRGWGWPWNSLQDSLCCRLRCPGFHSSRCCCSRNPGMCTRTAGEKLLK